MGKHFQVTPKYLILTSLSNLHGPTQPNKQADFTGLTVAQYQRYVAADVIIGPLVGNYTAVQNLGVRPIAALKSNRGFDQSQRGSTRIRSSTQSGKKLAAQPDQPPNPEDVIIEYVIRKPELLRRIIYGVVEIR